MVSAQATSMPNAAMKTLMKGIVQIVGWVVRPAMVAQR